MKYKDFFKDVAEEKPVKLVGGVGDVTDPHNVEPDEPAIDVTVDPEHEIGSGDYTKVKNTPPAVNKDVTVDLDIEEPIEEYIECFREHLLSEKNVPTNKKLWSRAKSLARSKFDVYPSAYANGWAAKWYKKHGGGWKKSKKKK